LKSGDACAVGRLDGATMEHRAAKVSLVSGLSTLLGLVFQFVSVPVCLHYWGKDAYGGWLALFSAFMVIRGLDGGYTAFVGNKLNYLYHQDALALHEHLSSAVFGVALISVLQLLLVCGTFAFEPLSVMLGMASDHAGLAAKTGLLTLMISWILTGSYLGVVHRLLIPAGLMYQAAWWAMGFQISQFVAIMASALFRLNLLETSALFALAQLAIYVASAWYVRRALPSFAPWLKGARCGLGFADLGRSTFLTASNLVQQGAINGFVLLISALATPSAVPAFTTVRTLTNLWTSATTILSAPLLPDVVRMHAGGEAQKLVTINRAYWVLVGSGVNLGAVLSYPLIPFLYGLWTAHAVTLDGSLLCLLLGSVVVANAGALMALHLNGINSLGVVLGASVVRATLGLGIGAECYGRYGLAAFGMGILAGEFCATMMTAFFFVRYEVVAKGAHLPPSSLGPVSLSTGLVLVFFVGAALGWWTVGAVWLVTLAGVGSAAVWGWYTLEPELQDRLRAIPGKLVGLR
jgi:O-antigen/teichoic acid export membrane protein